MAAPSTATAQKITNDLEATYQSLRHTAANIQSLLNAGRATCDEIKAYNLWALAIYNTQRGMLTALRASGEPNIPELPAYPTLFMWRGVAGADAWRIDCNATQQGLTGALRDAMNPGPNVIYLSTQEVETFSEDQSAIPANTPNLSTLVAVTQGSLGWVVLGLVIAGIVLAVTAAAGLYALANYWQEQSIQEETTARAKVQAVAFQQYTSARVGCYQDCLSRGYTQAQCTDVCSKLIDKPNIVIDSARKPGETNNFITAGAVLAIAAVGGTIWWIRHRRQQGMNIP